MSLDIKIRTAVFGDIESLCCLLDELFSIEEDFEPNRLKQQRGFELLLAARGQAVVFVATQDGQVVGMCSAQKVISTAEGAVSVWIEDVIVAAAFRGEGIGKELLRRAESWARTHHATRVQLLLDASNEAASRFYKRTGWSDTKLKCMRKSILKAANANR